MAEFRLEDLQEMGYTANGLAHVQETIVGQSRWSVDYEVVFRDLATGKYHEWYQSRPATEMQEGQYDESPDDMIECPEVERIQRTVWVYE